MKQVCREHVNARKCESCIASNFGMVLGRFWQIDADRIYSARDRSIVADRYL